MNPFRAVASWWGGFFDKKLWYSVGDGRKTTSLENVSEESALNYSAVWCATRLLCGTGASLPFPVYTGFGTDERSKARQHPLFRILNGRPNYEQTAYNFRSVMWQWQVNWGNAYAEIVREGDSPESQLDSLWPIHPARVKICRDDSDSLYYEVRNETGGGYVEMEPWQMLHIPSIITHDGICGHGIITHARESIGAGIAAEKYGAHWFGGAAVPRAVVEHPGKWNPESRTAFRTEWEEIYSGPDGHRMALLEGGAKVNALSLSAEDSQFLETRQFNVEEIARWYGIPPHMLQHLLRATFNNIEHLGINFVQYSLIPWLRIWEQCCWQKLLTEQEQEEYFCEHNVDALMRGDAASRSAFYQTMVSSALMTRNEVRKLENMDPVDGGDTFLVQGAMVPLDDDGKPVSEFVGGEGESTTTDGEDMDLATTTTSTEDVQATALNGAQIASLVAIGDSLVLGNMTIEGARAMIEASFPVMDRGLIDTMVKELGSLTEQKAKERKEQEEQQREQQKNNQDDSQPLPANDSEDVKAVIAGNVKRILEKDLTWLLTKETKKVEVYAKSHREFIPNIDAFYATHFAFSLNALSDALGALSACGVNVEAEVFVATWIQEGKSAMMEAAGIATATDLTNVIQGVIESKTWAERPIRAIERVEYASS